MSKTILIAEDEPALLKILTSKIKKLGFEVLTAEDGVEAIEKITKSKPDLVLLDIVMPRKNGYEVLEEIRVKHHLTTPVIILSNLGMEEDLETGKNFGVVEYIIKSNVSLKNLIVTINKNIGSA